jgi:N-acetylmuramoyl-L-alanine amidase
VNSSTGVRLRWYPDGFNRNRGKALFYFDEPTGFSLHVSPRFPESLDLARTLADQLAARGLRFTTFHAPDSPAGAQVPFLDASRGIYRRDHLFVLNHSNMPALLFEAGFIINRDEELILSSPGHQEKIASAMTDAVRKFCSADR